MKFASALLLLLGYALYGAPRLPDESASAIAVLGSFFIFSAFALGVLGWGSLLARRFHWPIHSQDTRLAGVLALGSVFASLSVYLVGALLGMGLHLKWLAIVWIVLGNSFYTPLGFKWKLKFDFETFLILLFLINLLVRVLDAFRLHPHGDAYICYLPAPRAWFDSGSLQAFKENYSYFFAASWEALYQWGNLLLAGRPGTGLDSVQRFAQWCSAFFGLGGMMFAATALTRAFLAEKLKRAPLLPLLTALAVISFPEFRSNAALAKNDVGATFWMIAGLLPLFLGSARLPVVASGIILGAGAVAKIPYAFFLLGALLAWLALKPRPRDILNLAVGGVIGASFILIRNTALSGNPLFPFLTAIFKTTLIGPEFIAQVDITGTARAPLSVNAVIIYFRNFLSLFWPLVLSPIIFFLPASKLNSRAKWLVAGAWLSASVFILIFRNTVSPRYFGPVFSVLTLAGVLSLGLLIEFIPVKKISKTATLILALAVIATSEIPIYIFAQIGSGFYDTPGVIVTHTAGAAKKWIREQPERTLSVGDPEIYYSMHRGLGEYSLLSALNRKIAVLSEPAEKVKAIYAEGWRYLYHFENRYTYISPGMKQTIEYLKTRPDCVRFKIERGEIFDLECILHFKST